MAKGKTANPADAYRKALRKKELKKNKAGRVKARDFALVKKDTGELEEEIAKLEAVSEQSAADKAYLAELKSELEKVIKKKEEYVAEHPEQRKLVFRARRQANDQQKQEEAPVIQKRNVFDKHGLPRHPERSIYYDAVMNPFGVAPPGMPYMERPLRSDEIDSDDDDDNDGIALPAGPPPGAEEEDSDDDIPMPEGPPPPKDGDSSLTPPLPPSLPTDAANVSPSFEPASLSLPLPPPPPPSLPVGIPPTPSGFIPPPPPGFAPNAAPASPNFFPGQIPPPPPGFIHGLPPPPPGFFAGAPPPLHGGIPPPPLGGFAYPITSPPPGFPQMGPPGFGLPHPPPGFFPRRSQSSAAMQDPLSAVPHQTFQAHRAARDIAPPHPSLPANPTSSNSSATNHAVTAAATISAEPQLRDLKKESTAFVPSTLKRKKTGAGARSAAKRINAAPSVGLGVDGAEDETPAPVRPDLLSTLKDKLGPSVIGLNTQKSAPVPGKMASTKGKDDYEKFLEEMGDILASKP